jgi:type II secretory pathway component PulF
MMTVVVPKLLEIFDDPSKLPQSTQTLMKISNIFENYWYLIIL